MRLSATQASREFSDLLSRVASGVTVEVERHGHVVAVVVPPSPTYLKGAELGALLGRLPVPDLDFARDVASLGALTRTPGDAWQS